MNLMKKLMIIVFVDEVLLKNRRCSLLTYKSDFAKISTSINNTHLNNLHCPSRDVQLTYKSSNAHTISPDIETIADHEPFYQTVRVPSNFTRPINTSER